MSTFKNIHVNDDIIGCIADYIIDQGVNGFVNWEKWKSGKLVQYGNR